MNSAKITVYIGKNALEKIIDRDDIFPKLNRILKNHAEICLNISDTEFDEIISDYESDLCHLLKNIKIVPLKEYFNYIKEENISDIADKVYSIFYLDVDIEEAKRLSKEYGVIVQSENYIDDNILQFNYYNQLKKGERVPGQGNGWENSFKDLTFPPFNSLVLTDGYLLANEDKRKGNIGFENLKLLLNSILPEKLKTVFHLLVITPLKHISCEKADKLFLELKNYLSSIRPYDFNVELILRDTIHSRKAYSNNFVIICDKGFKMFNLFDTTIANEDINDIRILSILHDPEFSSGKTMLSMSISDLCEIKKLCDELKIQINNGIINQDKKIIGDTKLDKTIKNRLLT